MHLLPNQIAQKLWVSERTIYNYKKKLKGQFKEERRNGKSYLEFEPFLAYAKSLWNLFPKDSETVLNIQKEVQSDSGVNKEKQVKKTDWIFWNLSERVSESSERLQNRDKEKKQLENYSNNLNEQVKKYALAFSEEKAEKKELQKKYDTLETRFLNKVEATAKYKGKVALFFALLGGLAFALSLILGYVLFFQN